MKKLLLIFITLSFILYPLSFLDAAMTPGRPLNQQAAHHVGMAFGGMSAAQVDMSPLPVRLMNRDPDWEMIVRSGLTTPSLPDLQNCQMMFSGMAETVWGDSDVPGVTRENECLTVVQLRTMGANAHQMGPNDRILAVAHVATGSHFLCNIDSFPPSGFTAHVMDVEFPPDAPPTEAQVLEVMNQEQRQNAGMRTAIGAIAGGAAMFMLGSGDTAGERVRDVAIGAGVAGGLTAASANMDFVAGQTVMAAGMHAATGAVVGNIAAGMHGGGRRNLVLNECLDSDGRGTGQQCLWGSVHIGGYQLGDANCHGVVAGDDVTTARPARDGETCFFDPLRRIAICDSLITGTPPSVAPRANAPDRNHFRRATGLSVRAVANRQVNTATELQWNELIAGTPTVTQVSTICFREEEGNFIEDTTACPAGSNNGRFFQILAAGEPQNMVNAVCGGSRQNAMIQGTNLGGGFNPTGVRESEFNRDTVGGTIVARNNQGRITGAEIGWGTDQDTLRQTFTPLTMGAEDGDALDFGNQARFTATVAGAGAGAALGGLGARTEALTAVQLRWVEELERYEAMTRRFYCISGTRFLGDYNMPVIIPQLPTF